jgi:mono/diheme cytochrome c family protein
MRRFLIAFVLGVLVAGVVGLVVALPLALTHRDDLPFERAYAGAVVGLVARLQAGDATNPVANDRAARDVGRAAYTGSCAICHGAKGDGRGRFGPALYPEAADLLGEQTKRKTDAELFWIIKNGLGFTAMPAFGSVYTDEEIWSVVTFLRSLQQGATSAIEVRAASPEELLQADPAGDVAARGAAVYFAMGCHLCHGGDANGPGELSIRGRIGSDVVRRGEGGMPSFGPDLVSDAELRDLVDYLLRFAAVPSSPD